MGLFNKKYAFFKQKDHFDCGPACLKIIAKHYGADIGISKLRELCETTRVGSSLKGIVDAAEQVGFRTLPIKANFEKLKQAPLPCIVHWNNNHFIVVHDISNKKVTVADPGEGILKYSHADFIKYWIGGNTTEQTEDGIALLMEPIPNELNKDDLQDGTANKIGFRFLLNYLLQYKRLLVQLLFGILAASLIQLIIPFLTQSIVDVGIQNLDIGFIYLVLLAQVFLFIGKLAIQLIRGWILLHLSTRIRISLISDFFVKLMKLPIAFFDTKVTGDIMQRIEDNNRLQRLLTSSTLEIIFSLFNLIVFGFVLAYYNMKIFGIFFIGSTLYFFWVLLFLKKRKELDYKRFFEQSAENSKVIELITGMQEIKLHNAEKQKRWAWEYIQARLFRIELKNFAIEQTQNIGSSFINEIKNMLITVLSAQLVIEGEISLGIMLSISYIVGQLNGPIHQLIGFVHSVQDTKISLERLSEIYEKDDETHNQDQLIKTFDPSQDIVLSDVTFRYKGSEHPVLNNLELTIPGGKTTAIVGPSGGGKTTLLKILLKFYEPTGQIKIGNTNIANISPTAWRDACGVVMQEGYIFNDTIAKNIAVNDDNIDFIRLEQAATIANIKSFITELPLSYNTKIGNEGVGMSTGQKQRLLIARAVYKNPSIILFDEATSALDANNERTIVQNLNDFLKARTAVVIAHRLSTVKDADQIVVIDKGIIEEVGSHDELLAKKGKYFNLVKNQLDLEKLSGGK